MIAERKDLATGRYLKPQEQCHVEDMVKALPTAAEGSSDIVNFFGGKHVFLTGATGFIGKLCMEKMLRTCPGVECIFILCRDKKGKTMHARAEEILSEGIFDRVHRVNPKCRHKIIAIKGDMGEHGLGISIQDRDLLASKVNIIIHCAATVRFDEKLRTALSINVRGTRNMLQLARECKHLQSFVFVSTAFAHCVQSFIDETYYDLHTNYDDLDALIRQKSDEDIDRLRLFRPWPNTYAFTKALAEKLVQKEAGSLPIAIFRPAIVVSTYMEPIRGWIDNVYGPTGVITGAGLGILRSLHCDKKNVAEIVPADWVVNSIIAIAHNLHQITKTKSPVTAPAPPLIYNYVSSVENPLTWEEYTEMNCYYGMKVPTAKGFWYYSFRCNKFFVVHLLYSIFLHWLPAYLIDGFAIVIGKKPQMVKIYSKIDKFTNVLAYFATRRWFFKNNNTQDLWTRLSDVDKHLFPFDIKLVDWEAHSHMNVFGVRTYILKDTYESLPVARKRWNRLFVLHEITKFLLFFAIIRLLYAVLAGIFLV